jgi:hypothetical protein
MIFDEDDATFDCYWSRHPTKKLVPTILKEYTPWRNAIFAAWSARTGKRVLLIDV